MRLHHTEVSPIYFQEGAPLTRAFGGKNKNTNHHSKCTCYFPSGVRDWIASESREKAADGPVWSLSPARSGERGRDLAQGAGLCEGRRALPAHQRALEEPSCQMPDAARAAVLAAPVAPCPFGEAAAALSLQRSTTTQAAWCQGTKGLWVLLRAV